MGARLKEQYLKETVPALTKEFSYTNRMAVPKIQKISLNIGMGEATQNSKLMDGAVSEMTAIAGQKPVVTKSKKAIAGFKIRDGYPIGCKVTLRKERMFEFLDRLITVAIPRIRDFRGISPRKFDGRGNYSLGISDQTIFPEIDLDKIKRQQGMDITFVTSTRNDDEARELLRLFGMPFRDDSK